MSPLATPIMKVHGTSLFLADSVDTTCAANPGPVECAAISGGTEMEEAGIKKIPILAPSRAEGAISASREEVDKVSGAPLVEAHSDTNYHPENLSTTGTGVNDIQSAVALRERAGVRVNTEVARPPSTLLVGTPTDSYPRSPYDQDMQVDQVDMQVDFSSPLDKDEEKLEPSFGVLSNTTFDHLLSHSAQPQLYSHGASIEEDDSIVEDIGPRFVADSVMEDARTAPWKADVSVTATETLQPFSWIPTSIPDGFHSTFPDVPFARTQMTAFFNDPAPVLPHRSLNDAYTVDTTTSEETRLWQVAPPQTIPWPFVSDGVVGLSEEPQSVYATHSPTPVLSAFASQVTSFPPSPPTPRLSSVPTFPPVCRPIEGHEEEVKDLDGEVHSEPAVAASVQRKASPARCV
jgi:hypothetical protein